MKRTYRVVIGALILGLAISSTAACGDDEDAAPSNGYPERVELTDGDSGESVRLAIGGELIISLESNPSTGFAWAIADPAPSQLEAQGEPEYIPPEETTPVVGAPGTQLFSFKATAGGTAELTLEYRRSFESDVPAEKTFTATVEIR